MYEKWIGEDINSSGQYEQTVYGELRKRNGGRNTLPKLYRFESKYGGVYYISDEAVIRAVEEYLKKDKEWLNELQAYLYNLVIKEFGVNDLIKNIDRKNTEEKTKSYKEGMEYVQKGFKTIMGIR